MDSNEIAFKSHQSLSIEKRQPQNDLLEMLCRELVQREMTDSKFVRPIKFGRYKVAIKTKKIFLKKFEMRKIDASIFYSHKPKTPKRAKKKRK